METDAGSVHKPLNSDDIARAVVSFLNYRRYVIVPNVSWGINMHECDLLAINSDHYATEVEIKISRSDLIADKKKPHHQQHHARLRRLMFAIPAHMNRSEVLQHVPQHAGIIVVDHGWKDGLFDCKVVRRGQLNPNAKPWGPTERFELARLGVMRFWTRRTGEPLPGLGDPLEMPTNTTEG